jgi:hemoglobin/transferrin/lactoferrin receptor protein
MYKFLLFLIPFFAFSQKTIILEELTWEPIKEVTLQDLSNKNYLISNEKGEVDLSIFKNTKQIEVTHIGYQTTVLSYQDVKNQNFEIYLTPNQNELKEIVVSVNKWKESKNTVTKNIFGIKKAEIALNNPQTSGDLLQQSGKVFVQKSQLGGGSPMIRGFATNRVLLNIDGVRMNNAIFRSGNIQNIISIDANAVDNVEVILGAGTTVYGSDAIGGVMNFYTKKPVFSIYDKIKLSGNVLSRWSSANNEKTNHFDLNFGLKNWAFLNSFSYSDFDDLRMGKYGDDAYLRPDYIISQNNQDIKVINDNPLIQKSIEYNQFNFIQKISYRPNYKWIFNYNFQLSNTSNFNRYDRLLRRNNNGNLRSAEWYYGPQKWMLNQLNINHFVNSKWADKISLSFYYQLFEESRFERNFNAINQNQTQETVNVIGLNLDFTKQIKEKNKFYYGGEILHNKVNSYGKILNINTLNLINAPSRYPNNATWKSFALYLNYQKEISEKTNLQLGTRYNIIESKGVIDTNFYNVPFQNIDNVFQALIGSIGFSHKINSNGQLFLDLSTSFRAPNIDDMGKLFESTPGFINVPNSNLKPEYLYNSEIGYKHTIKDKLQLELSVFYNYLNNVLVKRDGLFNNSSVLNFNGENLKVQSIQNGSFAKIYGLSSSISYTFHKDFKFITNVSYNKGIEVLDNGNEAPLRHAAPLFGNISLQYTCNKIQANLSYEFNGSINSEDLAPSEVEKSYLYALDSKGLPYVPSYGILNIKSSYEVNKNTTIYLGLENIFDKRYRPYSSGITAPGRNLIASVRFGF